MARAFSMGSTGSDSVRFSVVSRAFAWANPTPAVAARYAPARSPGSRSRRTGPGPSGPGRGNTAPDDSLPSAGLPSAFSGLLGLRSSLYILKKRKNPNAAQVAGAFGFGTLSSRKTSEILLSGEDSELTSNQFFALIREVSRQLRCRCRPKPTTAAKANGWLSSFLVGRP